MAHAVTFPTAGTTTVVRPLRPATPRPVRRPADSQAVASSRTRHPATDRGLRLTRRGRLVAFAASLLVLLVVVLLSGQISAHAGAVDGEPAVATAVVVVQPGESLWQLAQQVAPQSDPRAVVTTIRELNGLGTDTVVPGQSLIVPTVR